MGDENRSSTEDSTTVRDDIASVDIASTNGDSKEITDESLAHAAAVHQQIAQGKKILPSMCRKQPLNVRIEKGAFIPVQPDVMTLPRGTGIVDQSNPFQDDRDQEHTIDFQDEDDITDIDIPGQSEVSHVEPSGNVPPTDANTLMLYNSLRKVDSDIQSLKPHIAKIPDVVKKVDELQTIFGEVLTGFIEMKNTMQNLERTVSENRAEMAKLSDLFRTMSIPSRQTTPIPTPLPQTPQVSSLSEANITRLISMISKEKNFGPEQEAILRNVVMIKNKEVIIASLNDLQIIRPLMSAELEKIMRLNTGSSSSMLEIYNLLNSLIPTYTIPDQSCSAGTCTPAATASKSTPMGKKTPNPFLMN